ncbi:hypothetical protein NXW13_00815 [Bacteroides thetaiotaomicron]|nr:hypothetical protein [Bacteroides thetaiotaomicron]
MAENFKTDSLPIGSGVEYRIYFQAQLDIATKRIYRKGRERKSQGTGEIIQGDPVHYWPHYRIRIIRSFRTAKG